MKDEEIKPITFCNEEGLTLGKTNIEPTIIFHGKNNIEILRLEYNGNIYVQGRLAENDKEVVDGMRKILMGN